MSVLKAFYKLLFLRRSCFMLLCWRKQCGTYPAIMSEEDGVALYVSVDDTLCVEDRQCLQDRQTHRRNLLLVHPGRDRRHF